jgi:Transposase DDE domain
MLDEIVPVLRHFRVSLGDTAYNTAACLGIVKNNVNQVHISRVRNNKKFYYPYCQDKTTTPSKRGRPTVYGDLHKLNDPTTWHHPDEHIEFSQLTGTGKTLSIKIDAWNEVIMRGKKGVKLSDYPIRLLRVQVFKASGVLLFKRPLWLTAAGKRRMELSLFDVYSSYRQRFDIEHFFRFGKTRLLMDKIQTPDVEHEEAWWQLVMIAYTQLYLSRSMADNLANPWERHLPSFKQNETIKQPTIVQKDFERIIRMIGTPAQPPKPRKNAPGRQFGDTQAKRTRHPVVKKHKNTAATEKMTA